jgi:hypothetical protein
MHLLQVHILGVIKKREYAWEELQHRRRLIGFCKHAMPLLQQQPVLQPANEEPSAEALAEAEATLQEWRTLRL